MQNLKKKEMIPTAFRQENNTAPKPHPDSLFSRTISNIKCLSQGLIKQNLRASLVAQWLRIRVPTQP